MEALHSFFKWLLQKKKFANENKASSNENIWMESKGRGMRINLEGSKSISKLKVTAGGTGRTVTLRSPPQNKFPQRTVTSQICEIPSELVLNPFLFCFFCEKEAKFSCKHCKKPYCSANCQSADLKSHQQICKEAKRAAASLLLLFKNFQVNNNDSSYMSDNSNSDHEKSSDCTPVQRNNSLNQSSESNENVFEPVEKLLLSAGQVEMVTVVHIENPSKFWIQIKTSAQDLIKMEKKLSLQRDLIPVSISCIVPALNCCTLFNDKIVRVEVLKEKSINKVLIYLLDYGKILTVQKNALYKLPKEFRKLPAQAICCKLVDEAVKGEIRWNDDDSLSFQLHTSNKNYKAHILRYVNDVYEVSLINEDGITLYSMLAEEKNEVPSVTNDSKKVNMTTQLSSTVTNNSAISVHEVLSSSYALDHSKVSEKDIAPKTLSLTVKYNVKIVFIKTISELYVHLTEDEDEMNKMLINLNSFCSSENTSYVPSIGEIVCCKFSDGRWYRAQIQKKIKNKYHVIFIDYGNEDDVVENHIQVLHKQFISPRFGICVSLSGIKNEDVSKYLLSKLLEEKWDMKIIDNKKVPIEVMLFLKDHPLSEMIENKTNKNRKADLKFQKLPAVVTNVKICWKDEKYVYVNQIKDSESLDELLLKLNSLSALSIPKKPVINNVYCGLFSDGLWYRVSVEEELSSNKYKVFFLDYGNCENVSSNELRELPSDLFALPVYCIPVVVENREELTLSLGEQYAAKVTGLQNGVQNIKILLKHKDCSAINAPENEAYSQNKKVLKFQKLPNDVKVDIKICHEDEKWLYLHQVKDLESLDKLFVNLSRASSVSAAVKQPLINNVYCGLCSDNFWYRVSIEEELSSDMYKVLFLDYGNYENLSCSALRELPSELFEIPVFCIPVVAENREELTLNMEEHYTVRVTEMQGEHQKVKFLLQSEKIKLPHISSFKKQCLEDGVSKVVFCCLENGITYCQLSSDNDCVIAMFKELQQWAREGTAAPSSLSVGDVICAQSCDGSWYRACVTSNKKEPSYKLLFFDYGNVEFVTGDCIKMLPEKLLEFPVFAIPMKIDNADKLKDTAVYTKHMSVEKIKVLEDNLHIVKVHVEEDTALHTFETDSLSKISVLKQSMLPCDSISRITVCYVEDGIFYVHLFSNRNELAKLQSDLLKAQMFSNLSDVPEKGDIICAQFLDENWYRGSVHEVFDNSVKVHFIDYGNLDIINLEKIKILPPELCSYPVLCIPVKFRDIETVEKKLKEDICTFDVIVVDLEDNIQIVDMYSETHVKKSTTKPTVHISYTPTYSSTFEVSSLPMKEPCNVIFKAHVDNFHFVLKSSDSHEIKKLSSLLQETNTEVIFHLPSVNEMLIVKGKDNLWHRCCVEEVSSETCKVCFVDLGITEDIQKESLHCLPDSCKSFPLFAIKVLVETEEPVFLNQCYSVQVLKQNTDGVYVVKICHQQTFSSINHQASLFLDETDDVQKSKSVVNTEPAVNTENINATMSKKFTFTSCKTVPFPSGEQDIVIYNTEEGYLFCAPYIPENIQTNLELPTIITEHCNTKEIPLDNDYEPELDEMVLALYPEDKLWYRAAIIMKSPPMYHVNFVDYGNTELLHVSSLRKMEEQFMELDVQAHMCSLTGFTVSDDNLVKVYEELKKFTVFNCPEPLRACVQIGDDDEITVSIPRITSLLAKKNLVNVIN